jgi:hypothetical protein
MSRDNVSSPQSDEQQQAWTSTALPTLVGQVQQRPGITHLLLFTSLFVPLVFLPYIPLRRHMMYQTRQLEYLRSHLTTQLSVTKENSKKLAATIHENQQLGKQVAGLREEFLKINAGLDGLREENREKYVRDQAQGEWNQEILGAIERMRRDTRP